MSDTSKPSGAAPNEKLVLGKIIITAGAMRVVSKKDASDALIRHGNCDWGLVSREDWQANDKALAEGSFILSAYKTDRGADFWIITEGDRSVTTILLPEDY